MALVLLGSGALPRHFAGAQGTQPQNVHIGIGPVVPLAWWLQLPAWVAVPAATITVITAINHRWRLLPAVEDIERHGTVAYGVAISLLLILFWPEQAIAACAGVLVMALGDGLAGLVGRGVQSPTWSVWQQRKSVAGTLTMALVTGSSADCACDDQSQPTPANAPVERMRACCWP